MLKNVCSGVPWVNFKTRVKRGNYKNPFDAMSTMVDYISTLEQQIMSLERKIKLLEDSTLPNTLVNEVKCTECDYGSQCNFGGNCKYKEAANDQN